MKYMLLIYDNAQTRETFMGEQGEGLMAEIGAIMNELTESGELVGGEALADPSNTKTIRLVDGAPRSRTGRTRRPRSTWAATSSSTARAPSARPRSPCAGRARASRPWRCGR